ncbi:MAG: HIT family protein [Nanoarchaeota archaeon]|nr:HIT family protein [Nanoarchaeota archaeon]
MGCVFCNRQSLEKRLIAETRNFIFIAGKGQIVEGYSLIIPKKHARCYGELSPALLGKYLEFKEKIEAAMAQGYMKPMYFEHGIVGQTVYHAHMHCIPTDKDILHRLDRFYFKKISSEADLPVITKEFVQGSYFFYDFKGKFAFDVLKGLESYHDGMFQMALRHALADEMGIPEAGDWRNFNRSGDERSMQRTVEKLRPFFK